MRTSIAVLTVICLLFISGSGWAQLTPDQEKRLKELEAKEKALKSWNENQSTSEKGLMELEAKDLTLKSLGNRRPAEGEGLPEEGIGRYQAVRMDSNAVFIIDTKEGHLWVWVIQKDSEGQPAEFLFYQGKLMPGADMGELIDRTYKKGK